MLKKIVLPEFSSEEEKSNYLDKKAKMMASQFPQLVQHTAMGGVLGGQLGFENAWIDIINGVLPEFGEEFNDTIVTCIGMGMKMMMDDFIKSTM